MTDAGDLHPTQATAAPESARSATTRRATRQLAAVRSALQARNGFASARQLHADLLRRGETVGLTTIYRHLQSLSERREVDQLLSPSPNETLYHLCRTRGDHHHLVCRLCGHTVEVVEPVIENWAQDLARAHHFAGVSHRVEILGVCASCAQ